jgi:hypothetical protein
MARAVNAMCKCCGRVLNSICIPTPNSMNYKNELYILKLSDIPFLNFYRDDKGNSHIPDEEWVLLLAPLRGQVRYHVCLRQY